jgi:hypothetical protein
MAFNLKKKLFDIYMRDEEIMNLVKKVPLEMLEEESLASAAGEDSHTS